MALPTFVAAGTEAAGTTAVSPGLPAGWAADDIHLLVCETLSGETVTVTDWVAVTDSPQSLGGVTRLSVFWRRAVAGDAAPTTAGSSNHIMAQIFGFRGCPTTGNPWDVTSGGTDATSDTALIVPGDTTTVNDCLVVICVSTGRDSNVDQISGWANLDLANVAERGDAFTNTGGGGGIGVATGEKATAGAYGNTTATLAASDARAFMTIALKPVGGGSQSLTGTLFAKAATFNTGVLVPGNSLAGTLFTKVSVFPVGVLLSDQTLSGSLFTKAPTFPVGSVAPRLTEFPIRQQISDFLTGTSISGVLRVAPLEDNMVFALFSAATTTANMTGPSGYTKATERQGDGVSIQLWYKRAGAAESATVTATSSASVALKIHVWESPNEMFAAGDPLDVVAANDSSTTAVITLSAGTTATVSQPNTFAIAGMATLGGNADFLLVDWTAGFTALADHETRGLAAAFKVMTVAEAATATATWNQATAPTTMKAAGLVATFKMAVNLTLPIPAPKRVSFGSRRDNLNTTGTVDTVATFPIVTNHLYLALVGTSKTGGNNGDAVIPVSHGGSLTWTLHQSHFIGLARRVHIFRAMSGSDLSAASISITTPETDCAIWWTVLDVTGIDTVGSNGAGAIRQVATGDEPVGDTFVEASFTTSPLATSGLAAICMHGVAERQLVDDNPIHLLFGESDVGDPGQRATADWYQGSDQTFRWEWSSTIHAIVVMVELVVPFVGVSQIPNATVSNSGWDTAPLAGQSIHTYIATDDADYITVTVP